MGDRYRVTRSLDGSYTVRESDVVTDVATGAAAVAGNIIGASISGLISVARNNRDRKMIAAEEAMGDLVESGEFDQLFPLATNYARKYPSDPAGPAYLAIVHFSKGRFDEALRLINRAEQLDLPPVMATALRAGIYREMKDFSRALRELTALTQYPEMRQDAYLGRARTLIELGDLDQALADANQAVALGPDEDTYSIRGLVYRARGTNRKQTKTSRERIAWLPNRRWSCSSKSHEGSRRNHTIPARRQGASFG